MKAVFITELKLLRLPGVLWTCALMVFIVLNCYNLHTTDFLRHYYGDMVSPIASNKFVISLFIMTIIATGTFVLVQFSHHKNSRLKAFFHHRSLRPSTLHFARLSAAWLLILTPLVIAIMIFYLCLDIIPLYPAPNAIWMLLPLVRLLVLVSIIYGLGYCATQIGFSHPLSALLILFCILLFGTSKMLLYSEGIIPFNGTFISLRGIHLLWVLWPISFLLIFSLVHGGFRHTYATFIPTVILSLPWFMAINTHLDDSLNTRNTFLHKYLCIHKDGFGYYSRDWNNVTYYDIEKNFITMYQDSEEDRHGLDTLYLNHEITSKSISAYQGQNYELSYVIGAKIQPKPWMIYLSDNGILLYHLISRRLIQNHPFPDSSGGAKSLIKAYLLPDRSFQNSKTNHVDILLIFKNSIWTFSIDKGKYTRAEIQQTNSDFKVRWVSSWSHDSFIEKVNTGYQLALLTDTRIVWFFNSSSGSVFSYSKPFTPWKHSVSMEITHFRFDKFYGHIQDGAWENGRRMTLVNPDGSQEEKHIEYEKRSHSEWKGWLLSNIIGLIILLFYFRIRNIPATQHKMELTACAFLGIIGLVAAFTPPLRKKLAACPDCQKRVSVSLSHCPACQAEK